MSLIIVAGTFGLFLWEQALGVSIEKARTVAVNTLVMFEIFYVFNSRYLYHSVLNLQGLFGNRLIWIAILLLITFQMAFTYWQSMQVLFGTVAIDGQTWKMIVAVASSVFILVEIEKFFIRLLLPKAVVGKGTANLKV